MHDKGPVTPIAYAAHPNFTIIVNWKARGFGCSKVCTYCNWRGSPLLPHGPQTQEAVSAFISQCKKSFITISGGGDPLYKFDDNLAVLRSMTGTIKEYGFKVRVITREVQHVAKLKGIVDHVSISLDDDVLRTLDANSDQWTGMDVEYSLVLPPLPTENLVALKPQYAALYKVLGRRLVLRENFNSIFPVDPETMSFGHSGIVFVPKALCLNSRYLSTIDCLGHDIVQDNAALTSFLMDHPDAFLFGGFVRHLIDPVVHLEYEDIDVIATSTAVMDALAEKFAFAFKDMSPDTSYPRYFLGRSVRAGKTIQLVQVQSDADARKFIFNAQYGVDRVGYRQGLVFDPVIGEEEIRRAIHAKTAQLVQGARSLELFHADRLLIEQRHRAKLVKKGFSMLA